MTPSVNKKFVVCLLPVEAQNMCLWDAGHTIYKDRNLNNTGTSASRIVDPKAAEMSWGFPSPGLFSTTGPCQAMASLWLPGGQILKISFLFPPKTACRVAERSRDPHCRPTRFQYRHMIAQQHAGKVSDFLYRLFDVLVRPSTTHSLRIEFHLSNRDRSKDVEGSGAWLSNQVVDRNSACMTIDSGGTVAYGIGRKARPSTRCRL